jgi:enoyl-CoA hydratase/carnithine racemase
MVGELADAAKELASDDGVSVVLIRSDQEHFCAGADLKERETIHEDQSAVGGGAELALACDLRLLADDVRFGFSEVSLGIIPGGGGTQRLPRLIGLSRAKELIYSARLLDSSECLRLGLADHVVPCSELDQSVVNFAKELARNAPLALRAAKQAIIEGFDLPLVEALKTEGKAYDSLIRTEDREEGIKAFIEKRPPVWKGK